MGRPIDDGRIPTRESHMGQERGWEAALRDHDLRDLWHGRLGASQWVQTGDADHYSQKQMNPIGRPETESPSFKIRLGLL